MISIRGDLKTNQWEDNNGQKRSKTFVRVNKFDFIGGKKDSEGGKTRLSLRTDSMLSSLIKACTRLGLIVSEDFNYQTKAPPTVNAF